MVLIIRDIVELITVTSNEATIHLRREKTNHLPCTMQEYCDEEIARFIKTVSQYILINTYSGCSYGSYSSGYLNLDITPDKLVISNGEPIGFSIDNNFLPLDFSYYLYFSHGGDHTLSSVVNKYFLLKADEVGTDVLDTLSTSSASRQKIDELFMKRYS